MALTEAQFQEALNAEQKEFFTTTLKTATEAAAAKAKTDLEDARKKAVPDKYEVKFVDDATLDPKEDREKILEFAKARGMTNEEAQAFVDHVQERVKGVVSRQAKATEAQRAKWAEDTKNHKELGGANLDKTLQTAKRAMDRFAPQGSDLAKFIDDTGYGNHPSVVSLFFALGKAMSEDKPISRAGTGELTYEQKLENLYPSMKKQSA